MHENMEATASGSASNPAATTIAEAAALETALAHALSVEIKTEIVRAQAAAAAVDANLQVAQQQLAALLDVAIAATEHPELFQVTAPPAHASGSGK
jgi:hypothetical protein